MVPDVVTWALGEPESRGTAVTLLAHHPWETQALTRQWVTYAAIWAFLWTLAGWEQETSLSKNFKYKPVVLPSLGLNESDMKRA